MCLLEYVDLWGCVSFVGYMLTMCVGWTRFMEWKYPVEVVVKNQAAFKGAGAVAALASL